ncbi:MAG: translation initiation factor IF-2 N-terminal domain-containing protein, partial [Planctomycetota bacterium]
MSDKVRIHDLAKQYGMPGKDLASKLRDFGFSKAKSHMSALDPFELVQAQGLLEANGISPVVTADDADEAGGEAGGLRVKKRKKLKTESEDSVSGMPGIKRRKKPAAPAAAPAAGSTPSPTPEPTAPAKPAPVEEIAASAAPAPTAPAPPSPATAPEPAAAAPAPPVQPVQEEAPTTAAAPAPAVETTPAAEPQEGPATVADGSSAATAGDADVEAPAASQAAEAAAAVEPEAPQPSPEEVAAAAQAEQHATAEAAAAEAEAAEREAARADRAAKRAAAIEAEEAMSPIKRSIARKKREAEEAAYLAANPEPVVETPEVEEPAPAAEAASADAAPAAAAPAAAEGDSAAADEKDDDKAPERKGNVVGFIDPSSFQQSTPQRRRPDSRRLQGRDDATPDVRPTFGRDRGRQQSPTGPRGKMTAAELREREQGRFLRRNRAAGGPPGRRGGGGGGRGGSRDTVTDSPYAGQKVAIDEPITMAKLADAMSLKSSIVQKRALERQYGMFTVNQILDGDTATLLAAEFEVELDVRQEVTAEQQLIEEVAKKRSEIEEENLTTRPPTVAFLGHVDHGKTTLIDKIRESRVADKESGGITQHIGAYQVQTKKGHSVTIVDTPGHEAFTAMRARGAKAVDIVVLVVAGDDGVKPSTVEAINHAKAAETPIVVAINKKDRAEFNANSVIQQLM